MSYPDNKQKMGRLYPNLDYTELTTCGHFIHMEQPEMFNDKLKAFIATRYLLVPPRCQNCSMPF